MKPADDDVIRAVGLVGCSLQKLDHSAPARELYRSVLFRKSLAYAERTCERVYILSALWDLVELDRQLEPYNRRLDGKKECVAWGKRVGGKLVERHGREVDYVILAGDDYARPLTAALLAHDGYHHDGWHGVSKDRIRLPLAGMTLGRRLRWLNEQIAPTER